jgi:site-specific recombinase XerD
MNREIHVPLHESVGVRFPRATRPTIRGFLKFCKENQIIFGNPAETVEGPIREEKEPAILLKTEYKALLQVAGEQVRHKAKSQERNTLH